MPATTVQQGAHPKPPAPPKSVSSIVIEDHVEELEPDEAHPTNRKIETPIKKALLYPKLAWGLPPKGAAPTKGSNFLRFWEMWMALACFWVGMIVPYTLAFGPVYIKSGEQCLWKSWNQQTSGSLFQWSFYVDLVVDITFLIDIGIHFVSARWEFHNVPAAHWKLIDDLPTIRKKYLSGPFYFDVLAWVPLQHIDCLPSVDQPEAKILNLLRILKIMRLTRLSDIIQALKEQYPQSIVLVTFLQLFLTFFLSAHWMACIFFSVGYGLANPEGDEYSQIMFQKGWVVTFGLLNPDATVPEFSDPWITALYWAVTTMSTIGYGDISPQTEPERIIGMFLMVAGAAFFAWITGSITSLMTAKSACQQRFEDLMEEVDTFIEVHELPKSLQDNIKEYYKVKYPNKTIFEESDLISSIESPSLKKMIISHLFKDVVQSVALFRLCDEPVRLEICFKLKIVYRMSDRPITEEGQEPDAMYVIRFGRVAVSSKKLDLGTFVTGQIFGEMAMIGLTRDGKRARSTRTLSVCELCSLGKEDFEELLSNHTSFLQTMRMVSRLHVSRMRAAIKNSDKVDLDLKRLMYIDWKSIDEAVATAKNCETMRKEASSIPKLALNQAMKKIGERVLYTNFIFQINGIYGNNLEFPEGFEKALITISWNGWSFNKRIMAESVAHNDTATFEWKAIPDKENANSSVKKKKKGLPISEDFDAHTKIDVTRECRLPILTRHKVAWKDLPPFELGIVLLPTDDSHDPTKVPLVSAEFSPKGTKGADGPPHWSDGTPKSLTYPSARAAWVGKISLQEAVSKRQGISKVQTVILDALAAGKVAATPGPEETGNVEGRKEGVARIQMSNVKNPSQSMTLEVDIRVRRRPLHPLWPTLVDRVIASGSSAFFEKKIAGILDQVRTESGLFQDAIVDSRMSSFKNFKKGGNTAEQAEAGLEADILFAEVSGSGEAAAIGTMKIVLNSISEKLASHDKFLKDSNARIKNLKSSVSAIHQTVSTTVAGFMDETPQQSRITHSALPDFGDA